MGKRCVSPLVLIVDDDPLVREGLLGLIRSAGFATQGFASAEELLSLPDLDDTACVILDVLLPGMSGLELQRRMTAMAPNHRVPVVFITADDNEATRERALKGGAVDFLLKPVRREALLNALHLALKQTVREDINDRKRLQARLEQRETELARVSRLTTMGELAASIAHEVNQPLTAITNNGNACLRLLARGNLEPDVLRQALDEILADSSRASALLARLRALITKTSPS